jgi:eukaryotic-like serine/threonine-protein kinase
MRKLAPGTIFGRDYEILRCISTGGMGAVYEALHRPTRRRRALKVMLPTLLVDDDARSRFALEAVVTAGISSEHIVEVLDAGIDEGTESPFLAMELLKGEDLGVRTKRLGCLPLEEVVELLSQAALGLEKTHAGGIVHRDLKPENLFRTERDDGTPKVKILDFGIAKLMVAASGRPMTRAIGTPLYMAPEQLEAVAKNIGPAVDVYALGQIAFTLLVGSPYFDDEARGSHHVFALLGAVSRGVNERASVRARRRGADLPAGFDAWFAQTTALDPAARFDGALAATAKLAQLMQARSSPEEHAPERASGPDSFTRASTIDAGLARAPADAQSIHPLVAKTGTMSRAGRLSWAAGGLVGASIILAGIIALRDGDRHESSSITASTATSPPVSSSASPPVTSRPADSTEPSVAAADVPSGDAGAPEHGVAVGPSSRHAPDPASSGSAPPRARGSSPKTPQKTERPASPRAPPPAAATGSPPLLPWEQRNPVRP